MARKAAVPTKEKESTGVSLDEVQASNALKKERESKRNEQLTKDMMYGTKAHKRTIHDTEAEKNQKFARLHDFGGKHEVVMVWDINEQGIRDQVFMIRIGDKTAYLSAVQLQKYIRWI